MTERSAKGTERSVRPAAAVGWIVAIVAPAVFIAAPWLDERLVPAGWLGIAAGLVLTTGRTVVGDELAVLASAVLAIALAFHWTPEVLADAMRSSRLVGFAFAVPIVLWDACRLALPFWVVGRLCRDPRQAWLPAGLVAVVAEALLPGVFPWKLGYSQIGWPVTIQAADLFGPEWPTFMLYAHAGAIVSLVSAAVAFARPKLATEADGADAPAVRRPTAAGRWTPIGLAAIALVALNAAYGLWAMRTQAAAMRAAESISVALVQVDPSGSESIDDLRRLTREVCAGRDDEPFDLVCWPECSGGTYEACLRSFADPERIFAHSRDPNRGLRPLENPSCPLLFGGKIYEGLPEKPRTVFQSAILMEPSGAVGGSYRKRHLMPFGEYVPFADVIPELRLSFPMETTYTAGRDARPLVTGPARIGPLLCYEDMVPSAASSLAERGANLLVSLGHGAAFTNPLTLRQHRLLAQQRAIENRRCLVRSSSTGETCVIDPTGRIAARLPLGIEGVLVADVPLLEGSTGASRVGPIFAAACGLGLVGLFVGRLRGLGGLAGRFRG